MVKNIIKEMIIILLLTLAIILVLGVLLYRYTAYNKVLPEKVSYSTKEEIKQEIANSSTVEDQQPIFTYEVTASELQTYQKNKEYVQGRRDPFAATETSTTSTTGNTATGNTNTGTSQQTNTNSTVTNSSSDRFFPDKGTK